MARCKLWSSGLDYRHGTGHGVGAFLCVHEGPQGAASQARSAYDGGIIAGAISIYCMFLLVVAVLFTLTYAPSIAGMTLTDEPGYYEDGAFGIRIENVMLAKEVDTPCTFGGRRFLVRCIALCFAAFFRLYYISFFRRGLRALPACLLAHILPLTYLFFRPTNASG